jgi:hypothetical protein
MAPQVFWATPFGWTLLTVLQILAVLIWILLSLAFLLLADRKIWAGVQLRKGPNVVGPFGLLQSFADFLKFVLKEIVIPDGADKVVFLLAPLVTFTLGFAAWAVVPLAPGWVVSNINVGILYLFAISSLGVYGVIMGGWASNSKYPFLGSLRSAAQMVSYEVSIGFVIVTVILLAGSMNLQTIVEKQAGGFWRGPQATAHDPGHGPHGGGVLRFGPGRDQPPAVRSVGSRVRTRGRLSGGIFLDALPAVHDRRIRQHRPDVRHDHGAVLRRLAGAVPDSVHGLMEPDPGQLLRFHVVLRQGDLLLLSVRHGQGNRASLPL